MRGVSSFRPNSWVLAQGLNAAGTAHKHVCTYVCTSIYMLAHLCFGCRVARAAWKTALFEAYFRKVIENYSEPSQEDEDAVADRDEVAV